MTRILNIFAINGWYVQLILDNCIIGYWVRYEIWYLLLLYDWKNFKLVVVDNHVEYGKLGMIES